MIRTKGTFYAKNYTLYYLFIFSCFAVFGLVWAGYKYSEALRTIGDRDRAVREYRERDAAAQGYIRQLNQRTEALEGGLAEIRGIADNSVTNVREAIGILRGIQSVLKKMEENGVYSGSGSVSSGSR